MITNKDARSAELVLRVIDNVDCQMLMYEFEKYKTEIIDFCTNQEYFGVINGKPAKCFSNGHSNCNECDFDNDCTSINIILWLYKEEE